MSEQTGAREWLISVDTGGTFTDCVARAPDGRTTTLKVLSSGCLRVHAKLLDDRNIEISEISGDLDALVGMNVSIIGGAPSRIISRDKVGSSFLLETPIVSACRSCILEITSHEEAPVLAARLATGTPVGKKFPSLELRVATTRATNALLERTFSDCALFVTRGFGDILTLGNQQRPDIYAIDIVKPPPVTGRVYEIDGRLDPTGGEVDPVCPDQARTIAREARESGAATACVALMHSWVDDRQEREVASILRDEGFECVVLSSHVAPRIGYLDRTRTSVLEGALGPIMRLFIKSIQRSIPDARLLVMTSTGSLVEASGFTSVDGLLSGPAGGARGASELAQTHGCAGAIGLDMGGTSTDVVRIDGEAELVHTHEVGGTAIARPAVAIETIAAGGGSICDLVDGRPMVGPRSAGADPGPACYGRGGPLTLTDVNLLLERIDAKDFVIPIDRSCAQKAFEVVHRRYIRQFHEKIDQKSLLQLFLSIANNLMAGAIRKISTHRGFDPSKHTLIAFGGAGPQHACDVAELLGVKKVIVPERASILSAHGVHTSRISYSFEQTVLLGIGVSDAELDARFETLARKLEERRAHRTGDRTRWTISRYITIRYEGHDTELEIEHAALESSCEAFIEQYSRTYAITFRDAALEIVRLRLRATSSESVGDDSMMLPARSIETEVTRDDFQRLRGEHTCTIVPPNWSCSIQGTGDIAIELQSNERTSTKQISEVLTRELIIYKMSNIAEEMGEALRRTASSVNIRERKDYSCGVLDREGMLIASAPHMPVHLGALGACTRQVVLAMGPARRGEVWVTNHPKYGGSHLPDITTITPVFDRLDNHIGYVATRAHHAEIGGITPGSMPPSATTLEQEGVVIPPTRVHDGDALDLGAIETLLRSSRYPSRMPDENLADLRAAIVASRLASDRLANLADTEGVRELRHAMRWILEHTAALVRQALDERISRDVFASGQLDDGNTISVRLGRKDRHWAIDFSGTSGQHCENLNAPLSVTRSAIAYVMRLIVNRDIPLNDGLLEPMRVHVPAGSFLNPVFDDDPQRCPAVAAGNVEVSQRVTDTLIQALGLSACSQGTMNNLLIGNERFGYYETICGGAGATERAPGADGVHTHMTNTAITDGEVMEHRYPLRLRSFHLRKSSGGDGIHKGGDGVIRSIELLEDAQVSMNAQHRTMGPFGLGLGSRGMTGNQYIEKPGSLISTMTARESCQISQGDIIVIETPGGGGYSPARG